ncbi:hypothetical protein ACFW4K_11725 [Nocardiopsis alba]|uniref:hypothetical protein n=1 Tax=Nocardiopsis alba TaxID=53437 RepID=UPI00366BD54F
MSTDLRIVDIGHAPDLLRSHAEAVRGFLDTDPVTQNDQEIRRVLSRDETVLLTGERGALLGCRPSRSSPRQAFVACVDADPEEIGALLRFAYSGFRATSYVAEVEADSPVIETLLASGFTRIAHLREHSYRSGTFKDIVLLYAQRNAE